MMTVDEQHTTTNQRRGDLIMYSIVTKYGYECGFMSILDACKYADKMLRKGYSEYNSFYIVNEYDSVVFTTQF